MSSSKCARCEKTVYPVEGLRCLDKIWHKGCFKCQECNMTLNLKNYKGFDKKPYCNAHCPQAKATTVADTPEIRRLAENTRIQSQAKYHEDFEKSKGKGFTAIADDPETVRIKQTSKIISNAAYHGEIERKKQMDEKRIVGGQDESPHGRVQTQQSSQIKETNNSYVHPQQANNNAQLQYQQQQQQKQQQQQQQLQQQQQQQLLHQKHQQQLMQKQAMHQQQQQQQQHQQQQQLQQQQQVHYVKQHPVDGQRLSQNMDRAISQPQLSKHANRSQQPQHLAQPIKNQQHVQQQYPVGHPMYQQQHMLMRQQQQQQMIIMQQHRQSLDPNFPLNRQQMKQSAHNNNNHIQQHANMKQLNQMLPNQQQDLKYMSMTEPANVHIQQIPGHVSLNGPRVINGPPMNAPPNAVRSLPPNTILVQAPGGPAMIPAGYAVDAAGIPQQMLKQQQQQQQQQRFVTATGQSPRHMIHSSQIQQVMRPPMSMQHLPQQQQMPRRVFRAMYDYVANDVDEVSFFENDILIDCVNVDGNWLIGKVARSGQTGMLPANYVVEMSGR